MGAREIIKENEMINSNFNMNFATGLFYESVEGVIKPCEIKQVYATYGIGANQAVVALVSGKKIRVISGWICSHTAALSQGFFLSNGAQITANLDVAANTQYTFPFNPYGHFDSTLSQNLAITVATAACQVFLRYIEFTPA